MFIERDQVPHKFEAFPKIPRLVREIVITEKLDGTNAGIHVWDDNEGNAKIAAMSRSRYLHLEHDNYGFAAWVNENQETLLWLGPGIHWGEWWGRGIQRNYGLSERRFSLFNVGRWNVDNIPPCCSVVPTLAKDTPEDEFEFSNIIEHALYELKDGGSVAAPGFMNPEGIIIYHTAASQMFKRTFENDKEGKG